MYIIKIFCSGHSAVTPYSRTMYQSHFEFCRVLTDVTKDLESMVYASICLIRRTLGLSGQAQFYAVGGKLVIFIGYSKQST